MSLAALVVPWFWFLVRDRWPVLDLVAIGLPIILLVVVPLELIGAVASRRWWLLFAAASTVGAGVTAIYGPALLASTTQPPRERIVLATANIGSRPAAADGQMRAFARVDPDVLVVTEIDERFRDRLADQFPDLVSSPAVAEVSPPPGTAQVAVFSKYPLRSLTFADDLLGVRVLVDAPSGPFVLYALHLPKPALGSSSGSLTFHDRRELVRGLDQQMDAEQLPVVVAGDLNAPDRTRDYRILAGGRTDAIAPHDAGRTSYRPQPYWGLLRLRIDHVLIPDSWCSVDGRRFYIPGSDHRGVAADVGRCPVT